MSPFINKMATQEQSTLAEKNQKYWNTASKSVFKEKWIQDLQDQIFQHLRSNLDWLGVESSNGQKKEKLLDYACGNGLPSQALSPHFSQCIGMDVSEGMLEKYDQVAKERGLSPEQMHGVHGDLMSKTVDPKLLSEEMSNFDFVDICMALHHLEDPFEAVKRLVGRLKVGGTLLVIDWATSPEEYQEQLKKLESGEAPQQSSGHQHGHTHGHEHQQQHQHHHNHNHDHDHGEGSYPAAHTVAYDSFAREQMEEAFTKAGCTDFDFLLHERPSVVPMARKGQMQLFFARGRKTAA